MPSNFEIAALDAEQAPVVEERTAEITFGAKYVSLWRKPTPGQYAMFQLRLSRSAGTEQAKAIDKFFGNLMLTPEEVVAPGRLDENGVEYAVRLEEEGQEAVGIDFLVDIIERGLKDEAFLLEILEEVLEIHAGFPTSPQPGSSSSPRQSGPPSTARSRRQASTRSS